MSGYPLGKLPAPVLERLLARHGSHDPRVLMGPGIGLDAAVIDLGDRCLVAKTDPVTFATDEIGWYAVHVNANDVACCGATPRWFLATVLLPENGADEAMVRSIFGQIDEACGEIGASLCGGHTEITAGLDRPLVVGQMLGEVAADAWVRNADARPGDALILTKGIALEGTALLARELPERLAGAMSRADLESARALLHEPGISVVRDARLALEAGGVHALHDPTEGGLATGLAEVAAAAGAGLLLEEDRVPILPECEQACRCLGLDAYGLIASGSLLVAAAPERAASIVASLAAGGIGAAIIGELRPTAEGLRIRRRDGRTEPLPEFPRDEIARLFDSRADSSQKM